MDASEKKHAVAVVGINQDSIDLLATLVALDDVSVVKILNPCYEPLSDLARYQQLETIVDTSGDPAITEGLRRLRLPDVEILSGLSARILFGAAPGGRDEQMRKLLRSINEIRAAVRLAKDKDEILKLVLNLAIQATHADSGSIMLIDRKKKFLKIEVAYGLNEKIVKSAVQKIGSGISGTVAKTKTAMLTNGAADPRRFGNSTGRSNVVSSICSPLAYGDDLIGVVNISSHHPNRIFSERDLNYVSRIASYTTEIIKTSKEYEETSSSTFSLTLERSVRDILSLKFRFEEQMSLLVMKLANSFNAKTCNYYEFQEESRMFLTSATSSFSLDLVHGKQYRLNDSFTQKVLESRARVVHHVQNPETGLIRWYIAQPVTARNELAGLLFLNFESERGDVIEESRILERIAGMVGVELTRNREISAARIQAIKYSAISEFSFDMASTGTFSDLISKILSNASLIIESETCIFRLHNPGTGSFDRYDYLSLRTAFAPDEIDGFDAVIARNAVTGNSVVHVKDLHDSPYALWNAPFKSVLGVAFLVKGRMIGTLTLYDKKFSDQNPSRSFTDHDKEVFVNYCLQISKAFVKFVDEDRINGFSHSRHPVPKHYERPESIRMKFDV